MNYLMNYKAISNKDNKLRLYRKDNNKRLYVSNKLIDKSLSIIDNKDNNKQVIIIEDKKQGLKVNKQGFISLNKLDNKLYDKLASKELVYSDKLKAIIDNK